MKLTKLLLPLFIVIFAKSSELNIKITKEIPYFYTYHKGIKIKVMRIQDTANRLSDDYTKTSRECPPFCIHPTNVAKGVETIGEVELIKYMKEKNSVVVDARLHSWYEIETIPSAINIPFSIFEGKDENKKVNILKALGMRDNKDFSRAKKLLIFCNGIWCDQSPRLIKQLLKYGYPDDKLKYYRDGFQGWKLLGLTTVIEKENKK